MIDSTIPYWYTRLGTAESDAVAVSIAAGKLSQGTVTAEFERRLGELFGVDHVVATTSGTMAIYLAAVALGIGPGDEVILPDRTFVATANAILLTGADVTLVDVETTRSIIDSTQIEAAITPRTKAIVPVHLNGNAANMPAIRRIADSRGLFVIEDACQAFASQTPGGYLGTQSDAGCYSLGVTKLITTGQGGCVVTNSQAIAERMRQFRTHGVCDTFAPAGFERFGLNLRYSDIAASIGLVQLSKLPAKIDAHRKIHAFYERALAGLGFLELCSIDPYPGAIPLWVEALVSDSERFITLMAQRGIQIRPYLPSLHMSSYLGDFRHTAFPNSNRFARLGVFLPSGPDMPQEWLDCVVAALWDIAPLLPSALALT